MQMQRELQAPPTTTQATVDNGPLLEVIESLKEELLKNQELIEARRFDFFLIASNVRTGHLTSHPTSIQRSGCTNTS